MNHRQSRGETTRQKKLAVSTVRTASYRFYEDGSIRALASGSVSNPEPLVLFPGPPLISSLSLLLPEPSFLLPILLLTALTVLFVLPATVFRQLSAEWTDRPPTAEMDGINGEIHLSWLGLHSNRTSGHHPLIQDGTQSTRSEFCTQIPYGPFFWYFTLILNSALDFALGFSTRSLVP